MTGTPRTARARLSASNRLIETEGTSQRQQGDRGTRYETQAEYVWSCANIGRSFLFCDKDGNMIQIWENAGEARWS